MSYASRKAIRWLLPYVFSEGHEEEVCVTIPRSTHRLIMSIVERFYWSIWVDGNGNNVTPTDTQIEEIDYGVAKLIDTECEDMDFVDILHRLEELENMNINVNCGCGCGCSCNGNPFNVPVEDTATLPPLPPVPSSNPVEGIDGWKCDAATELVEQWHRVILEVGIVGAAGAGAVSAITHIAVAATVLTAGVALILLLVAALAVSVAGGVMGYVKDWIESHQDELVCVIYQSASPAAALAAILAYIEANRDDPYGSFMGYWIGNVTRGMANDTDWSLVFTPDSMPISASNVGSSCVCSGGSSDVIPIDEEGTWYLVPAYEGAELVTTAELDTIGINLVYQDIDGEEAVSELDFTGRLAEGRTWLGDIAASDEFAGFVLLRLSGGVDLRTFQFGGGSCIEVAEGDFQNGDAWSKWMTTSELPKVDFQAGVDATMVGYTVEHTADRTLSNADQLRVALQAVSNGPHAATIRVYACIKSTALAV